MLSVLVLLTIVLVQRFWTSTNEPHQVARHFAFEHLSVIDGRLNQLSNALLLKGGVGHGQ